MPIKANLIGRLRNLQLSKSRTLLPLFEAVVNSIHSIDERLDKDPSYSIGASKIDIVIKYTSQLSLDAKQQPKIIGFNIIDNGIGFEKSNYESFQTLDSLYKQSKGCHGIGRLLWLKAFERVNIESCFYEDGFFYTKKFSFEANEGVVEKENEKQGSAHKTVVSLEKIQFDYIDGFQVSMEKLSNAMLEHCLWYFFRDGGAPNIIIHGYDGEISLNDKYESLIEKSVKTDSFEIKGRKFELIHVKLNSNFAQKHEIAYCAANRVVRTSALNSRNVPGLFHSLKDGDKDFYYAGYLQSDFLTEKVNAERTDFAFAKDDSDAFARAEPTLKEIDDNSFEKITAFLDVYLKENREAGKQKILDFVNNDCPKYKPILKQIPEKDFCVDPQISKKDLDIKLHRYLADLEEKSLEQQHNLTLPQNLSDPIEYEKQIKECLSTISDLKKSDLANYVMHRKAIIKLFEKAIEKGDDGKYKREDVIHSLIMPMQIESGDAEAKDANLWLVDEKLAFHDYLASDLPLKSMPISGSDSAKEPDLLGLNIYDNPLLIQEGAKLPLATITVVEFKRPMRDDMKEGEKHNPIEQALSYLERVRDGKAQMPNGRPIPNSESVPGFCYVLSDLTPSMIKMCRNYNLKPSSDKMGFFGYHDVYNAYIEVNSFDRIVNMAKERNRAFFDKLGLAYD
jgi:hypothetical protein